MQDINKNGFWDYFLESIEAIAKKSGVPMGDYGTYNLSIKVQDKKIVHYEIHGTAKGRP